MAWTDERIKVLTKLWADGQSASKIAETLGGVTRNAVIGKVHRLGLSNRVEASDKPPVTKKRGRPAKAKNGQNDAKSGSSLEKNTSESSSVTKLENFDQFETEDEGPIVSTLNAETLASVAELEQKAKKLNLMDLTERTCKWPIGDPSTDKFWFCGHPSEQGKPYCSTHISIAFQPMSLKRERKVK